MKVILEKDDMTSSVELRGADNNRFARVIGAIDRLLRQVYPSDMRHKSLQVSRDTTDTQLSVGSIQEDYNPIAHRRLYSDIGEYVPPTTDGFYRNEVVPNGTASTYQQTTQPSLDREIF